MILFSDFDKTFYLKDDEEKTRANFEAVKKWRAAGHQFCITTGRSYSSVSRRLPKIKEICDYYIVDSGSIVLSDSGEILHTFYFDQEVVDGIVKLSKSFPEEPVPIYYTPDYEGMVHKRKDVTKLRLWFKDLGLLEEAAKQTESAFPVSAFPQPASHKELVGYRGFIEIIPKKYGKSNAIKVLQKDKKLPVKDVITVGDGLNDYNMVRGFDGYAITGSVLSGLDKNLDVAVSVASLINKLLS